MMLQKIRKLLPPKWAIALFVLFCFLSSIFYFFPTKTVLHTEFLVFVLAFLAFPLGAIILLVSLGLILRTSAKKQDVAQGQKTSLWVGISLMSFLVAYALTQNNFVRPLPPGSNLLKFDARIWSSESSSGYVPNDFSPRQKMLGDVVRNVIQDKSRNEIEKALGPSLETGYFSSSERDLIYVLGAERGFFGIDSEWLLIWVDDEGQFERYAIYTD